MESKYDKPKRPTMAEIREEVIAMTGWQQNDYSRGVQAALRWVLGLDDRAPQAGVPDPLPLTYGGGARTGVASSFELTGTGFAEMRGPMVPPNPHHPLPSQERPSRAEPPVLDLPEPETMSLDEYSDRVSGRTKGEEF